MEIKCKCGSIAFLAGPKAGLGQNIKCSNCGRIYLMSPFGMEEVSHSPQNDTANKLRITYAQNAKEEG